MNLLFSIVDRRWRCSVDVHWLLRVGQIELFSELVPGEEIVWIVVQTYFGARDRDALIQRWTFPLGPYEPALVAVYCIIHAV